MEPIDGLEKLARLMRSKVVGKSTRVEKRGASTASTTGAKLRLPPTAVMEQELRAKVQQLSQLSATRQAINQTVIGTMLAWEYSDQLRNEPKFNALVQLVQRHIENEPKLNAAFQHIIEQLS